MLWVYSLNEFLATHFSCLVFLLWSCDQNQSIFNLRIESDITSKKNHLISIQHTKIPSGLILAIEGLKWVHERKISTSDAKLLFHKSHPSVFCGPLQPLHPLSVLDFIQLFIHWPFVLIHYLFIFKANEDLTIQTIWNWMYGFAMKACKICRVTQG